VCFGRERRRRSVTAACYAIMTGPEIFREGCREYNTQTRCEADQAHYRARRYHCPNFWNFNRIVTLLPYSLSMLRHRAIPLLAATIFYTLSAPVFGQPSASSM